MSRSSETCPNKSRNDSADPFPCFCNWSRKIFIDPGGRRPREIAVKDVNSVFDSMISSQAAQDKLQHYHSRIKLHYLEPRQSAAYLVLGQLSQSDANRHYPPRSAG
jgi:hypothetical protein